MIHEKWQTRFLDLAEHIAEWSLDPNTKVGSIIVDNQKRVIAMGYNGFPRGVNDDEKRYAERETKHKYVVHAERNALDNAPLSVEGCTLISTLMPCNECAKGIIQKGIKTVICYKPKRADNFNWEATEKMFSEAGVELIVKRKLFDILIAI